MCSVARWISSTIENDKFKAPDASEGMHANLDWKFGTTYRVENMFMVGEMPGWIEGEILEVTVSESGAMAGFAAAASALFSLYVF